VVTHEVHAEDRAEVAERILFLGAATRKAATFWHLQVTEQMNMAIGTMHPHVSLAMPPK
jgi:hypothetical protein